MNEMTEGEKLSAFARFQERFSMWTPLRRVFFMLLIVLLVTCIPMALVWIFPPPIIVTLSSYLPDGPNLQLAFNWSIYIPIAIVVIGVFVTNIVFSSSEDPRYHLRFITLVVCIEIAILATGVALAAYLYWFGVFAPIFGFPIPVEPFPGAWMLFGFGAFFQAHYFFPLLLVAGGATMLFVFLCESAL